MRELVEALDAFCQEYGRCGLLDGGVDGERVWLACECGARTLHRADAQEQPRRGALRLNIL